MSTNRGSYSVTSSNRSSKAGQHPCPHHKNNDSSVFIKNISQMEETIRKHTESARLNFYKQQAAWWKSQFLAAQYQNKILTNMLDRIYSVPEQTKLPVQTVKKTKKKKYKNKNKKNKSKKNKKNKINRTRYRKSEHSGEDMEFELSEEFKQFLYANRQHREERERLKAERKKERGSESETERVERMEQDPTDDKDKLKKEQMKQLYGDTCTLVEGLETHIQMKYDLFCDKYKPAFWPNIPLNL